MISPLLRAFLFVLAVAYGLLGAILFLAPGWASGQFAWRVSPFVAMTIGGWCIGTALACFIIARRRDWATMLGPITYLTLFGLFETAVLVSFRANVITGTALAWLYLATIVATGLFALLALAEAWRQRAVLAPAGRRFGAVTMGIAIVFILLVGFLGLYGLLAVQGMPGLNASIFPERLTPFSLRAFGSFYFALALAVIPLVWLRGTDNVASHGFALYGLLVFITAAAIVFLGQFDFAARPTQAVYIGIYLLVGVVTGIYLLRYGTGARRE